MSFQKQNFLILFRTEILIETKSAFEIDSEHYEPEVSEPGGDTKACEICFVPTKSEKMISMLSCQHYFCNSCTKAYLENCVMSFKVKSLRKLQAKITVHAAGSYD